MNLTQKNIIILAILLIACVFIYTFIIYPTISDIRVFYDRIQIERVSLENKYTSRRNIKNIIADLKYVTNELDPVFSKIAVQKGNEVEFISSLEKLAKNNNLAQKIQLSSAQAEKEKLAQKRDIAISLSGGYIDVLKYMEDLERSKSYVIINSISISSGKNQAAQTAASSGEVKANLQGYVFFAL